MDNLGCAAVSHNVPTGHPVLSCSTGNTFELKHESFIYLHDLGISHGFFLHPDL